MVPTAIRPKRGIAGVERNRPGDNRTPVGRISRCVKDRSPARMFGVIDRAVVEWCYRVHMGGD